MALMNRRALSYENDCPASFCSTLRSAKPNHTHVRHASGYGKGWAPGTKGGLKVWNVSGCKVREIREHSLFPPKTEFTPCSKEQVFYFSNSLTLLL